MSGTPEARPNLNAPGTVLGFDFGTRKVGVALGNTLTGQARALVTLHEEAKAARFAAIAALIAEWGPSHLVVGRPLHADGTPHATTALAEKFARELERRFGLPVAQVDERYTTQLADAARRSAGGKRAQDPGRDAMAAQLILQAWLDSSA
jgi:putative Holliday junction resolvase